MRDFIVIFSYVHLMFFKIFLWNSHYWFPSDRVVSGRTGTAQSCQCQTGAQIRVELEVGLGAEQGRFCSPMMHPLTLLS
jgi:hypothetical protein